MKAARSGVPPVRSTLQENAFGDAVWRKAHSFATKSSCWVGGSAILSTGHYRAFRIPNTEVKNPHCRSVRYKSQCGERLVRISFQGQGYLGHSPWESRSSPGKQAKRLPHKRGSLLWFVLHGHNLMVKVSNTYG